MLANAVNIIYLAR